MNLLCSFSSEGLILSLCKSFCMHGLDDTVSPEKLSNLNRARILIPFPPTFESGTERLWFACQKLYRKACRKAKNQDWIFLSSKSVS